MKQIVSTDKFDAFAESRIGGRNENQDKCGYQETDYGFLVVVCDGMGGGPSGALASTVATEEIVNYVLDCKEKLERTVVLEKAVKAANARIMEITRQNPALAGMGTTVAALLINEESAVVAHVGDSRIYQIRKGRKVFRTFDHSKVFELVKGGVLTEEQARISGDSNIITRALGQSDEVVVDVEELPYEKHDRFLLCTDGVWGTMPEKELLKATRVRSAAGLVESLAIMADEIGQDNGGHHDNLTLAIVETKINSKLKQPMSTRVKYLIYALCCICAVSIICNIIQANRHPEPKPEVPTTQVADTDKRIQELEQTIKQQNEEFKKRSTYFNNVIDTLKKQLDNNKTTEAIAKLDGAIAQRDLNTQLDKFIETLRELQNMKAGDAKNKAIEEARKEYKKIGDELAKMKVNPEDIKFVDNELKKPISARGNDGARSQYALIIEAVQKIKTAISQ